MLVSCAFRPTTIAVAYNRQQFIAMCTGSCRPCGLTVAGILSYVGKKAVYTAKKSGTDVSKKWYGPHIFARVNYPYHVLGDAYGPVFFLVLGPYTSMAPKPEKHGSVLVS